ncbi:FMN-binding negative transcriptional regulator [Rossellomorea sp. YZS02]|uniref:FMN-binding negative transcriptional regulator n=1 Tax=Rossellomorea sp. YZS02 TaxID=3097358 RepID=UPI002A135703|nr:FMN-binding negative transcriptional regulator [Rossellomorea sp. YZS02]MDX8346225.1 FMN-binding negative transcriptional regulator [Rossellomorea sp. YZS02]
MYIPKEFIIQDQETLFSIIEENSFAILFSQHSGKPFATHLPLLLDRENHCLYGHFAKANPQWRESVGQEMLIVFQGPHAYISPSWYETDQTVPTWNYVAVHVYGNLELLEDESEVIGSLSSLVKNYEHADSPYSLDDVDEKVQTGLRKGIVGFKIPIRSIEGKAKLSQNHPLERQQRVIEHLEQIHQDNSREIAFLMKKNIQSKN